MNQLLRQCGRHKSLKERHLLLTTLSGKLRRGNYVGEDGGAQRDVFPVPPYLAAYTAMREGGENPDGVRSGQRGEQGSDRHA